MTRRGRYLLLGLLVLPALAWGQASVLNGNRIHAGWTNYGTTAGTATAYTLTFSPPLPGYVQGQCFLVKPHVTNTGSATLNVQAKGALSLVKESGGSLVPLVAGDLLLGRLYHVCHDGANLQLLGTAPDGAGTGITDGDKGDITVSSSGTVWTIDPGTVTYAKLQPVSATARLLGRATAGAGSAEELTAAQVKTMLGMTFGDISGDLPYTALTPATAASRLLGRGSASAGDWQEVTLGTNLSMSGTTLNAAGAGGVADGDKGDVTVSSSGTVWTIDPETVTYAKLQNTAAASVLLGRGSAAGAGDLQEITLGTNLSMSGTQLNAAATAATAFSALTGGTNTTAAMVIGTGASLGVTGTGTVTATTLATNPPACSTNLFATDIAANGTLTCTQPTFANLSGTATAAQLPTAAADGTTRGVVAFAATDFECTAGLCSLDYLNGQVASSTTKGFLTSADWSTFNAKQAALGYVAENSANKDPSAALGASNTAYPTQGAVKTYVDSGVKALTNTAVTPRPCTAGPGSPIMLNADNLIGCDFVQIAELSGATTFDISGTFVNNQFLTVLIYTATQRALTWTSGAGKFAAEGITLPTFTRPAGYVLYGFRYNALSNRWALASTNQDTNYGTAGYVQTAGGPGVEASWQPPAGGGLSGTTGTIHLPMSAVRFPAANFAVFDGSETNGRLLFDGGATPECAYWGPFRMNADYSHTPVFKLQYSMSSATSGGVSIDVSVMTAAASSGVDMNTESYATVNNCDQTPVPAVLGDYHEISCPLTNNDGMAANRLTKIKLCRATGDAVDTATTSDLEGLAAALEYVR